MLFRKIEAVIEAHLKSDSDGKYQKNQNVSARF